MLKFPSLLQRFRLARIHATPLSSVDFAGRINRFRVVGADPQMLAFKGRRPLSLEPGIYRVNLDTTADSARLVAPKLYLDYGKGFSEENGATYYLARIARHRWSKIIRITERASKVRLDPSETASGEFTIVRLAATRLRGASSLPEPQAIDQDVFCAAPFVQGLVTTVGDVKPCPVFLSSKSPQAAAFWNGSEMRSVRQQMLQGVRPAQCRNCEAREKAGVRSVRQVINRNFEVFRWGNPSAETLEDLAALPSPGFELARGPLWLELNLGNLCNLRCRTCSGASSSRVASDPVQSRWTDGGTQPIAGGTSSSWPQNPDFLHAVLGADLAALTKLEFKGGEPFLIKSVRPLLQHLIDIGKADDIELVIVTSAAVAPKPMLDLIKRFSRVSLIVSVDGIGALNDYIRDGSRWAEVVANIALFRAVKTVTVSIATTVQAYNMLHITDIARFAMEQNLGFSCNMLREPEYLSCFAMPEAVRAEAVERIRRTLSTLRNDEPHYVSAREALLYVVNSLEVERHGKEGALVPMFMKYTNELDVSRNQEFSNASIELFQALQLKSSETEACS